MSKPPPDDPEAELTELPGLPPRDPAPPAIPFEGPPPRRSMNIWAVRATSLQPAPDWAEDERRRFMPRREIARLVRRGRARLGLAALAALFCVGFVVRRAIRRVRVYEASITLRLTEGVAAADTAEVIPPSELKDYVVDVWLSKDVVLPVVEQLHLYPTEHARDPALAVAALRDDLTIDVYRNYFQEFRTPDDPPRSAHIYIAFTSPDPEQALLVVQALGKAFVDFEHRTRRDASSAAAAGSHESVLRERADLLAKQRLLTQALIAEASGTGDMAAVHISIQRLRGEIQRQERRLGTLEARDRQLALYSAAESQQLGLEFDLVDVEVPKKTERSPWRLILIGLITFLVCLPVCALTAGAFDARILEGDDVRRLGVELLGHVPAFAGDDVGTLSARRGAGAARGAKRPPVRK